MKLVEQLLEDQVYEIFPTMLSADLFENKDIPYDTCYISVFDHWLTEAEASDDQAFSKSLKTTYVKKLNDFYNNLFKKHKIYCYLDVNWGGRALLTFSSEEEYLEWVDLIVKERLFLRLIIPELKVIINGGHDFTLPTFLTKDADICKLKEIVQEHGLFILK